MSAVTPIRASKAHIRDGQQLIDGKLCTYGDAIRVGDIVKANFSRTDVSTGGGLFLLEHVHDGHVTWTGCRRMTRLPNGIALDDSGDGDWQTVGDLASRNLRVVATVEAVYHEVYRG